MNKIRKGDEVAVLTGKDKGKRGTVLRVDEDVVVVEGVNRVKKHVRPNPMKGESAASSKRKCRSRFRTSRCSMPRPRRLIASASKVLEDGRKVRVFKSNGEVVDVRVVMARLQEFYKETIALSFSRSSATSRSWKFRASPRSP